MTPPRAPALPPDVERSTEMYRKSREEAERERRGQLVSRAVRLSLMAERAAYDARRVLARL